MGSVSFAKGWVWRSSIFTLNPVSRKTVPFEKDTLPPSPGLLQDQKKRGSKGRLASSNLRLWRLPQISAAEETGVPYLGQGKGSFPCLLTFHKIRDIQ